MNSPPGRLLRSAMHLLKATWPDETRARIGETESTSSVEVEREEFLAGHGLVETAAAVG